MKENIENIQKKYSFLHSHVAKEPYIFEVLNEISRFQEIFYEDNTVDMATIDDLKTSRNIKIPESPAKNKIIANLLILLQKSYPDEIKTIVTFHFTVDPDSKKLSVSEIKEFTIMLTNEEFNRIQTDRNSISIDNLLNLIQKFRLFNLTKLYKNSKEKNHLSKMIKSQIGKNIFSFKNFTLARNNNESIEDYCFHKDNYEAVKKILDNTKLSKIISKHPSMINRHLKKFGILNSEFSDYTDSKLDYLLNILLEEIPASLDKKELITVKNYDSLRSCLLTVENLIDPLRTVSDEIVGHIQNYGLCSISSLLGVFNNLTEDIIYKWASGSEKNNKLIVFSDDDNNKYIIVMSYLFDHIFKMYDFIIYHQDDFSQLNRSEKRKILNEADLLCKASKEVFKIFDNGKNESNIVGFDLIKLKRAIEDYEDFLKSNANHVDDENESFESEKKRSPIARIFAFIKSIFVSQNTYEPHHIEKDHSHKITRYRSRLSRKTMDIFNKIKNLDKKIIALSNYIELIPENESKTDAIINDLRAHNHKIVIPVYNARNQLYPNRSHQYLISDIEYLLIDPDIIQTSEAIRDYADSLAGEKIRDERIPSSAILMIEKYLLTIYRQNKIKKRRKP